MALSVHIKKKLKDFELAVDFDMDEGIVGFWEHLVVEKA